MDGISEDEINIFKRAIEKYNELYNPQQAWLVFVSNMDVIIALKGEKEDDDIYPDYIFNLIDYFASEGVFIELENAIEFDDFMSARFTRVTAS
ncbi:MAG: hypothetical protein QXL15_03980 [Candidatus Korarchaeota archaeon]